MFEKMADNVLNQGQALKKELKVLYRQDVGIEITRQIEDKEDDQQDAIPIHDTHLVLQGLQR